MGGHDRLLTQTEVATLFHVGARTVRRWKEAGHLSDIRTPGGRPRYLESEIRALIGAPQTAGPAVPPGNPTPAGPVPDKRTGRAREEHT